jgi:hypothetical protein
LRKFIGLLGSGSMLVVQLLAAVPATAAPGDRSGGQTKQAPAARPSGGGNQAKPSGGNYAKPSGGGYSKQAKPSGGGYSKPAGGNYAKPAKPSGGNYAKPAAKPGYAAQTDKARPGANTVNKGGNTYNKGGNKNNVNINNNNVNINHNTNINNVNRYPAYRPAGGGYYRPPNGGYYGPPRPPYGGWHGGYYPPPRYYYNDGPSVGGVLFGVAVTTSLLALLSAASQPDVVYVQGVAPPPLPAYVPPVNTSGAPALINVDINAMPSAARPSASTCLTEAARQIGATGGSEIRVGEIIDVEEGNGGYRFRLMLVGVYPDATRNIPMYCRATPDKIVELTFG